MRINLSRGRCSIRNSNVLLAPSTPRALPVATHTDARSVCAAHQVIEHVTQSFKGLRGKITVVGDSYYHLPLLHTDWEQTFDVVYHCGVLYHNTDMVLGLRAAYMMLKPGGFLLLETQAFNSKELTARYDATGNGNWWSPTPTAVGKMLENAGFVNTRVTGYGVGKFPDFRTYAIAQRPLKFTSYTHQGLPFYPC